MLEGNQVILMGEKRSRTLAPTLQTVAEEDPDNTSEHLSELSHEIQGHGWGDRQFSKMYNESKGRRSSDSEPSNWRSSRLSRISRHFLPSRLSLPSLHLTTTDGSETEDGRSVLLSRIRSTVSASSASSRNRISSLLESDHEQLGSVGRSRRVGRMSVNRPDVSVNWSSGSVG